MQVLVIGGGGREHALVWKIKQSPKVEKKYFARQEMREQQKLLRTSPSWQMILIIFLNLR